MEQTQKIVTKKKVSSRRFWKILFVFAVAFFVFGNIFFINADIARAGTGDTILDVISTVPGLSSLGMGIKAGQSYEETGSWNPLVWMLNGVLKFCVWIVGIAAILFDWIIKPDNVTLIMGNEGIYQSWAMVRDFLNLGFILVLLYIAFCVIFQIGSYSDSWKKMLLMMVIMALLVNFSFPICRVIIDFSNVAFYYIVNVGFEGSDGSKIFTKLTEFTGIQQILGKGSVTVGEMIGRIVFTFILGITLLVVAILFVVRMVVLGLLIIFSPLGFAGAAFPFSKKYASDWWGSLFKYAFFAPIMMFMILIAYKILQFTSIAGLKNSALKNIGVDTVDENFIGSMALFTIPVVILWTGMHMAQEMSIKGASAVTGTADKFAKWAGKKASGADFAQRTWGAYSARRKQADEDRMSGRLGRLLGSQQDRLRGALPGGRDAQLRYERDVAARIKRESERNDTANMNSTQLRQLADSGDRFERAAAMLELASRNQAEQRDLDYARQAFGEGSQAFRQLQNKVKSYDPMAAFNHLQGQARDTALRDHVNSNQFDYKKLNANSATHRELLEAGLGTGNIGVKDIEEQRGKLNDVQATALRNSLGTIANSGNYDDINGTGADSKNHRNIHMAYLAQSGTFSNATAGNRAFRQRMLRDSNDETLKRFNDNLLIQNDPTFLQDFEDNVSEGKLAQIMPSMQNRQAARSLMHHMRRNGGAHRQYIQNNPALRGLYV